VKQELLLDDGFLGCLLGEHDNRHRRCVSRARARLENTQVAARALLEARADFREQLADDFLVPQAIEREAATLATLSSLASVISGSTTRRSSLAFGSVVLIVSCFSIDAAMLRNMALRCELLRPSLRPDFL
jgi:hypothetical protein